MNLLLALFVGVMIALAIVGYVSDRRAASGDTSVTPGLKLLPGDVSYKSPNGKVQVYFPIVTSIVVSVVLSLLLALFR